jgi:hypothetical protein
VESEFENFMQLIRFCYGLGWYQGRRNLFTLRMQGEFEGFSRQATETWEQRFVIETEEIQCSGGIVIPAITVYGQTVEAVSKLALNKLTGKVPLIDEDIPI